MRKEQPIGYIHHCCMQSILVTMDVCILHYKSYIWEPFTTAQRSVERIRRYACGNIRTVDVMRRPFIYFFRINSETRYLMFTNSYFRWVGIRTSRWTNEFSPFTFIWYESDLIVSHRLTQFSNKMNGFWFYAVRAAFRIVSFRWQIARAVWWHMYEYECSVRVSPKSMAFYCWCETQTSVPFIIRKCCENTISDQNY